MSAISTRENYGERDVMTSVHDLQKCPTICSVGAKEGF